MSEVYNETAVVDEFDSTVITGVNGEVTNVQPQGAEPKPKYNLNLPKLTQQSVDSDSIDAFEKQLQLGLDAEVLGTIGIAKDWKNYQSHTALCERYWDHMLLATSRINGTPTPAMRAGYRKVSLRKTTQEYMESLSTPLLRKQAQLFDVDYDSFESQEDIIAALVQAHVDMVEVG